MQLLICGNKKSPSRPSSLPLDFSDREDIMPLTATAYDLPFAIQPQLVTGNGTNYCVV